MRASQLLPLHDVHCYAPDQLERSLYWQRYRYARPGVYARQDWAIDGRDVGQDSIKLAMPCLVRLESYRACHHAGPFRLICFIHRY